MLYKDFYRECCAKTRRQEEGVIQRLRGEWFDRLLQRDVSVQRLLQRKASVV